MKIDRFYKHSLIDFSVTAFLFTQPFNIVVKLVYIFGYISKQFRALVFQRSTSIYKVPKGRRVTRRERDPSSRMSQTRIRYNLQELGTKI